MDFCSLSGNINQDKFCRLTCTNRFHVDYLLKVNASLISLLYSLSINGELTDRHINECSAVIQCVKMDNMSLFEAAPVNCCIGVYLQGVLKPLAS